MPETWQLRDPHVRAEAALPLDAAARRLAAARDVLPAWQAELLGRLERSRGHLKLGRSSLSDYGREELGLTCWQIRDLRRLGRAFVAVPRLRTALLDGAISVAQARKVITLVKSDDELDDYLKTLAGGSARAFHDQVDEARRERRSRGPDTSVDVGSRRLAFRAPAAFAAKWRTTIALARQLEGPQLRNWQAAESIAAEWLSGAPLVPTESDAGDVEGPDDATGIPGSIEQRRARELWKVLEEGTNRWEFLGWERPRVRLDGEVEAELHDDTLDPHEMDRRLRYLLDLGCRLDWLMGRVLSTIKYLGVPRSLGFASFGHYVSERLGTSERRAYELMKLNRDLFLRPLWEEAFRRGDLSWVQARALCRLPVLEEAERAWLARARAVTVARLEDDVTWSCDLAESAPRAYSESLGYPPLDLDATLAELEPPPLHRWRPGVPPPDAWAAGPLGVPWPPRYHGPVERDAIALDRRTERISIIFVGPTDAIEIVERALALVRVIHDRPTFDDWQAMEVMVDHFAATHDGEWAAKIRRRNPVLERDGWRCQMPGCRSGGSLEVHHLRYRSQGGNDDPENLLTLCWTCHHRLVHDGYALLAGRAPNQIVTELGVRPGFTPRSRWLGERRAERRGALASSNVTGTRPAPTRDGGLAVQPAASARSLRSDHLLGAASDAARRSAAPGRR